MKEQEVREHFVSLLCSSVFSSPVLAVLDTGTGTTPADLPSTLFQSEGYSCSFQLEPGSLQKQKKTFTGDQLFWSIFAKAFESDSSVQKNFEGWSIREAQKENLKSWKYYRTSLYSRENTRAYIGSGIFGESASKVPLSLSAEDSCSPVYGEQIFHCSLRVFAGSIKEGGDFLKISEKNTRLFSEALGKQWSGTFDFKKGRYVVEKEVAEQDESLLLNIKLGAIELSLSDALNLRPGVTLEVAKPEISTVTLCAGDTVWATGQAEFEEKGGLKITVDNIADLPFISNTEESEFSRKLFSRLFDTQYREG